MLFASGPKRGIDVGAKMRVLSALKAFSAENNTTVVIISSELEELRAICSRIAIIAEGEVAGILPHDAKTMDFDLLMSDHRETQPQAGAVSQGGDTQ